MLAHETPLAVVGMACRFPGEIHSPEEFWRFLVEGRSAVSRIPEGRWDAYATGPDNAAALARTTQAGHFLSDIAGFDADFFGISPREAIEMDPQQRIMLEVAWEALERAGIPPHTLAGTDTGVFVGVGTDDYGRRLLEDLPNIQAWTGIGASLCAVPNRISYTLDLRGPSIAVDTACSASLAAFHLACESLRLGETPLVLVGGVMLMAGPGLTMVLDAAGAISPDGESKAFAEGADGYGRGEGCGALVLKRLADAERDGDPVLAVVRGSGVHQDGRTNGIMAPSREAQAHLLRRTWERAGLDPATADFVEAHGTGTRMGDPIEAGAMAEVFGAGRPAGAECLIGSVKTNIGHLEAGSGVAGLIKAVLALGHGVVPPSRYADRPNPAIPWAESGLRLVAEPTPLPVPPGRPRRAGVSGYGYGGTIAHVILEAGTALPRPSARRAEAPAAKLFPVSGASPEAVAEQADRLATWLSGDGADVPLADVGHTLAHRRAHLPHRRTVVAADRGELVAGLRAIAAEPPEAIPARPGAVWVFSGHGSQWIGMGRQLLRDEPVFAAALDDIAAVLKDEFGRTPEELVEDDELTGTGEIQVLIFAMQIGLAAVLRSHGLEPDAVIGHSVGEIAAAVTAGVLSPADGARLVCRRSRLLDRVAGRGAMVMVSLPFAEVEAALDGHPDAVAAISAAPSGTVVSGTPEAIAELKERWSASGIGVRAVNSDVAFHGPQMDALTPAIEAACAELEISAPALPVYSTAMADPRTDAPRDGGYWAANLRRAVRFTDAVRAAVEDGHRHFVEISAHPVVTHSLAETLLADGVEDASASFLLRRGKPELTMLLEGVAELYRRGLDVGWRRLQPAGGLAGLPVTAWRHRHLWRARPASAGGPSVVHDPASATLLGGRLTVPAGTPVDVWHTRLDVDNRPYPGDHPVRGTEIIPAAVLLSTFLRAAAEAAGGHRRAALTDVGLRVPVAVTAPRDVQVVVQAGSLRLVSRLCDTDDPDAWLTHTVASSAGPGRSEPAALTDVVARCATELDPGSPIERLATVGVAAMGFPWVVGELREGDGELLARVGADTWAGLLDAALSVASTAFPGPQVLRMPARVGRVEIFGEDVPAEAWIHTRVSADPDTVDVAVLAADGTTLAVLERLAYGRLDTEAAPDTPPAHLVHEPVWRPAPAVVARTADSIVVVDPHHRLAAVPAGMGDGVSCRFATDPAAATAADAVVFVPPRGSAEEVAWAFTETVRALGDGPARLWCVTEGVRAAEDPGAVAEAALWGLGRIVATEYPDLWGGVIDVEPGGLAGAASSLPRLLRTAPLGEVIGLLGGESLVERLERVDRPAGHDVLRCTNGGTYLVTGGLGALGLEVARHLADRGARRLVLAGRTALPPRADWAAVTDPGTRRRIDAVLELEGRGVTVRTVAVDVADAGALRVALGPDALGLPPIRGIVHAAGVVDSRMLADLDRESLAAVLAPKAGGALALHELFPVGSLDFFVLFSSAGFQLGLPGQASYAAANAVLDGLARHRGDGTASLAWTSWRGLGMSTSSAVIDLELGARGTGDITASEAFAAWDHAWRRGCAHAVVLRILPEEPGQSRPAILAGIPAGPSVHSGQEAEVPEWDWLPGDELEAYVTDVVRELVAEQITVAPEEIGSQRPLVEAGLDSIMAVLVRRGLERRFRVELPSTLLWNHPTVAAVGRYVTGLLTADEDTIAQPDLDLPASA
ncbi:type I polyketide synthase [Amycolatopsis sp. NPDC021455]|uniref:type I polyketide synthase n=1 Tax=Amycolatopsis sp. NPDC021455 TaxID=3154901 RepID=UPI0033D0555B